MRRAPFASLVGLLLAIVLVLALVLLSAAHATAQQRTVTADAVKLLTAPCAITSGSTSPTGGADCDLYLKSDGTLWQRAGGTWVKVGNVGSGTVGQIPKWVTSTTFGDSVIAESTGNVGIGTTGPGAKLHVDGNIWMATSNYFAAGKDYGTPGADASGYLELYSSATGNTTLINTGTYNMNFGVNNSVDMTIQNGGNVGIGTTTPGAKLHVDGNIWMATSNYFAAGKDYGTPGADASGYLELYSSATGNTTLINTGTYNMNFGVNNSVDMTIQNGGNVGIGTTTPSIPLEVNGSVGGTGYASQTTGWRVTNAGAADFRYLYTDELHAKSFIADLEQALAGGQIIPKGVAVVSSFTCPAAGATATLAVEDLPGAADMQVFQANDWVALRSFSRSGGGLAIADCVGQVSAPDTSPAGTQNWTFTRGSGGNAGTMSGTTVVLAKSLALDYGVSGNGYYEVNSIDGTYGANSPYMQIATWATSPVAANRTVRLRTGQLIGVTGTSEYGIVAGTYAATNGSFFRASNTNFDLQGITAKWWDGATNVVTIAPNSGSPYIGLGSPAPSACCTTAGVFLGWDHAATKAKASFYSDTNNYLTFDGTKVTWKAANTALDASGNLTATGATLTNGQIVFDNGTFMKVAGMGFGSTSQFIEWWGPHLASLSSCTEANAVYYLKTDGSAYFGGALLAGLLRNFVSATVPNDTNVATLGGFSSNGGSITTTWGYDFYANTTYIPSDIAGWTAADRTAPTATFLLERSTNGGTSYSTVWNNTVCTGTVNAEAPNGVDPGHITKQVNCGGTYADPDHNTNARAYRLSFVSDAHVFLPGGVTRNTLALGSVEQ